MREIKFRAYGEIQCYYLTSSGWKPKKQMCQVSSLNIKTHKCRVLYKGENGTNEYDTFELSKVNLMQYTGLKDKNGKEIFEGDVVNFHQFLFDGNEYEETGKGVIKSGEYGWILSNIIHDGMSDYMGYSKQDQLDGKLETYLINVYGLHEESFEVIGNIYENNELLND